MLAAEDIAVNRRILQDLLEREGAQVRFGENGAEALALLAREGASEFDCVLMDVQMPGMDGYEATRRMHRDAPELPVIGLTAHALAEERERCLAAGMLAVVTKPVDPDELVEVIRTHTGRGPSFDSPRDRARPATTSPARAAAVPTAAATDPDRLVDLPRLRERYDGDTALLEEVVQTTIETQGELADRLREAVRSRDALAAARAAHTAAGVVGYLEAPAVLALARRTEALAGERPAEALQLAGELAGRFERLLAELALLVPAGAGR